MEVALDLERQKRNRQEFENNLKAKPSVLTAAGKTEVPGAPSVPAHKDDKPKPEKKKKKKKKNKNKKKKEKKEKPRKTGEVPLLLKGARATEEQRQRGWYAARGKG